MSSARTAGLRGRRDTVVAVFCPKCGETMIERDGELTCVRGNMGLSQVMRSMLTDYCDSLPLPEAARATTVRWGGRWCCPLDGSVMSASDTELPMCPECDRIFSSRIVYQLSEVHPHR